MKINMTEQDAFEAFHEKVRKAGEYACGVRVPPLNRSARLVWQIVVEALELEFESVPSKRPQAKRLVIGRQRLQGSNTVPVLVDESSGEIATEREYLEAAAWYNINERLRDVLYGDPKLGTIGEIVQRERTSLEEDPW